MVEIFLKVLLIMAVFIAFAVPGFALKKLKMIGEGGTVTLSNLLLYVCQPALAIKAFCVFSEEDWNTIQSVGITNLLKNSGLTLCISALAIILIFALCKIIFIKSKNKSAANVYSFVAVFSNCGFFGIPFVEMFTDGNPIAVMYIMVFNIVFNVMIWTLGIYLITGDVKQIRLKKLICNPTIIAMAIALLLFFVPQINIFMMDEVAELPFIYDRAAVYDNCRHKACGNVAADSVFKKRRVPCRRVENDSRTVPDVIDLSAFPRTTRRRSGSFQRIRISRPHYSYGYVARRCRSGHGGDV